MVAGHIFSKVGTVKHAAWVSLPCFSLWLIPSVKAENERRLINPRELDLYALPATLPITRVEEEPSILQEEISKIRKVVWSAGVHVMRYWNCAVNSVEMSKEEMKDFYAAAQADPTLLLKPSVISMAILAGMLYPGRGRRRLERVVLASAFGVSSAAICYPKQAIQVSKGVYKDLSSLTSKVVGLFGGENSKAEEQSSATPNEPLLSSTETPVDQKDNHLSEESSEGESSHKEETTERHSEPRAVNMASPMNGLSRTVSSDKAAEERPQAVKAGSDASKPIGDLYASLNQKKDITVGDFGQADPEDKDMYSTR